MYRSRRRHGVLLLIVLCVLFMFLLLALTYTVVASKERAMTRNYARYERSGDPPNVILDQLAMILFRDTNDPHSPFRSWSLLEGIYGNVSFRGTISSAPTPQAGGQFLQFNIANSFNTMPNYYKGCVLTMLSGQCAGLSTRIVASSVNGNTSSLTVMRFQADAGLYDPAANDLFLINGRAYCGMGRGYNTSGQPATGGTGLPYTNDAVDPSVSGATGFYALEPNPVGFQANNTNYNDPAGPGGANVDYTAPDYNNCYLGLPLNFPANSAAQIGSGIIASFFRPDLYNYWQTKVSNLGSNAALLRKISFRPNSVDNPIFCNNTNPGFSPINWATSLDVDNTGGGTPDSIWIDPGLPVMTARDGRTYKVLVAPCILDLDGRINVNAHGSGLNLDSNVYPLAGATATSTVTQVIATLAKGQSATLPIGSGYGPAEVNLNGLFSQQEIQNLIDGSSSWPGRYGVGAGNGAAAASSNNQALEAVKFFEYPNNAPGTGTNAGYPAWQETSFGTPSDLKGRHVVALDPRGQPNFVTPNNDSTTYWENEIYQGNSIAESPYGFKLDRSVPRIGRAATNATIDQPFTVGELEAILRQYDVDFRSLPQRLYGSLPSVQPMIGGVVNSSFDINRRWKITTDSWDPPVPNLQVPRSLRAALANSNAQYVAYGISDLIGAKLATTAVGANPAEIAKLLPPELIAGLRMDINRPFGNGHQDNTALGLGEVDAPGGIVSSAGLQSSPDALPETMAAIAKPGFSSGVPFNLVNGSSTTNPGYDPVLNTNTLPPGVQARQLMARHLYALMMMLSDQQFTGWISQSELANDPTLAASPLLQLQLGARRIAQWAINVVSFRDSTSIMTPFMYQWDIYQSSYNGWVVDGDPGNTAQATQNYGVVWACKPPDALLSETFTFHDKRIGDTNWDTGNSKKTTDKPPDQGGGLGTPNFDQVRIPQGSAFFEIYSTRNPNAIWAPGDLYTQIADANFAFTTGWWTGASTPPAWCLDLGRMAPASKPTWPVWRLVIGQSRIYTAAHGGAPDAMTQAANNPDTTMFEPMSDPSVAQSSPQVAQSCQQMNLFDPTKNIQAERIVWLGNTPPTAAIQAAALANGQQIYYNRATAAAGNYLPPGGYAVVGPRATTYVGAAGNFTTVGQWGKPSLQAITLTPESSIDNYGAIAMKGPDGTSNYPANSTMKPPVAIIAAADPPSTWTGTALTSQKTQGIGINISEPLPSATVAGGGSAYYPQPTVQNPSTSLYDCYGDPKQTTATQLFLDQPLEELGTTLTTCPLQADAISKTGTTTNYRTVFLQRLADPTSGYDALRNPYITVDWMPIDLTVFNGEDLASNPNPQDTNAQTPSVYFTTRQRGGSSTPQYAGACSIWTPLSSGDTLGPATVAATGAKVTANFPYKITHTFGSLNTIGYGPALTTSPATQYIGDPAQPFPWIAWNARPYASPIELLNVPASSPERLLFEFNSPGTQVTYGAAPGTQYPPAGANPYQPGTPGTPNPNSRAPFGHLLNFLNTASNAYTAGTASNFYQLLEFVQVPSRFIGSETFLDPAAFPASGSAAGTQYFLPPFNYVSSYRDPGKINLNTITDPGVYACLFGSGANVPTFQQFCDSRRGDGQSYGTPIPPAGAFPSSSVPTFLGNVFRSPSAADLVPVQAMLHTGVDATILRAGGASPDSSNTPLFGAASGAAYNNTSRNSYFAYQNLERMSNSVTTRSNVFAVWLTIGYFEAIPNGAVDAGHPDGYQIGEEIGSDTGEVERHRAFYIFDRSIPVGYERGQNHNVNRAILLHRYIE